MKHKEIVHEFRCIKQELDTLRPLFHLKKYLCKTCNGTCRSMRIDSNVRNFIFGIHEITGQPLPECESCKGTGLNIRHIHKILVPVLDDLADEDYDKLVNKAERLDKLVEDCKLNG